MPYILEQGVLDHAGCRYVLSGCMCADIFATVRHPKPTAGISAGISKSARLVAINAGKECSASRYMQHITALTVTSRALFEIPAEIPAVAYAYEHAYAYEIAITFMLARCYT